MSQHAAELCTLLVGDIYGELTSHIFKVLLCYGRSNLPVLQYRTQLSLRQIKHGLSVLVQQHLVLWYTSSEDNSTSYEANTAAAYTLVRSGKYVSITEAQLGHSAAEMISNLLLLGHARVGDLVQAHGVGQTKTTQYSSNSVQGASEKGLINGFNHRKDHIEDQNVTLESIHKTLCDLLQFGLVSLVHISHFRSDADNRREAEKEVPPPEEYKARSKRDQDAQKEAAIKEKLDQWKYGSQTPQITVETPKNGKKRPLEKEDTSQAEKRRRLHLALSNQYVGVTEEGIYQPKMGESGYLDNNLALRVNHAKFAVFMRNDRLVALSDRSISAGTSKVYAKVLESLVRDIRGCQDKTESVDEDDAEPDLISLPYISTDELVAATEDFSDLSSALGKVDDGRVDMRRFDHRKKRRKKEVISEDEAMVDGDANPNKDEDESSSNGDDNISDIASSSAEVDYEAEYNHGPTIIQDPHRATIREHLFVLSMHPYKFLHYLPGTTFHPERWTVDFPTLSKNVIHDTLLQTITSRHGLSAARLVRLLHEKGKVDEKQLCSLSLLAQKTMRSALLPMHKAGMIGLQEVPRDSSRNPQRTNFLWFFDAERCKVKLLEETYKAMARCVQRAKVEEEKVKGTVEKASRSDVIGREEDFLGVQEMEALRRWRETEEVIGGEVGRLDDLARIEAMAQTTSAAQQGDNIAHALAGAGGGLLSMTLTYPLITLSTRAQVESKRAESSTYDAVRRIIQREGVTGLYSGLDSALFGISVTNFVYYYWYEWTRAFFERAAIRTSRASKKLTTIESMIAGAIAGSATVLITNPIWVVNTRMTARQAESSSPDLPSPSTASGKRPRKPSTLATLTKLFKTEGPTALFAGVLPALILVINPILQYTIFEQLKDVLEKRRRVTPRDAFFLGAIGKLLATSITYPYITVKSRMHVASKEGPQDGMLQSLKRVVREEGWGGLYKGIGPKVMQSVITAAFLFAFKDALYELSARRKVLAKSTL